MTVGLDVGDVVQVSVSLSPQAGTIRNFGSLLIIGDSGVIDTTEGLREYTSSGAIASDFGATAPEALAAQVYFAQSPQPQIAYVGAWARTATHGKLTGGLLSNAAQSMTNFTNVNAGAMAVTIDGTVHNLSAMDFSQQSNLNGVASVVTTALAGSGSLYWDANNDVFRLLSATTGMSSTVSFASAPGSGVDVSGILGLSAAAGGFTAHGIPAETPLTALARLEALSNDWYGAMFAASVSPTDSDYEACATYIEAASPSRIMGVTVTNAAALNPASTTDLAYALGNMKLNRTFTQYSSTSPYACAADFGNAFGVDFSAAASTITLKFKQAAGVPADTLTETAAGALRAKSCNMFVNYANGTAIIQEGVMCSGQFFDVIHGSDWLQNDVQSNVYDALVAARKIPQTDAGMNELVAVVSQCGDDAVLNGYFAPGVWRGPAIGSIKSGDTLSNGYYVFAPSISTQSQGDRSLRKAPPITMIGKLAGAFHDANVQISIVP